MKKFLLICTALCFNALADNNPCQNPNSSACTSAVKRVCRNPKSFACRNAVRIACQKPDSSACTSAVTAVCQKNPDSRKIPNPEMCRDALSIVCNRDPNSQACTSAVTAACQKNPNSEMCRDSKEFINEITKEITMRRNCKTQEGYWFNSSCKNLNQGKTFNLPAGHTLSGDVYNLQPFQSGNFVTANTKSSALNYIDNGYYPTCVNCSVSGSQLTCECLDSGFDSYVKSSINLKEGDTCISNNNGTMTYC